MGYIYLFLFYNILSFIYLEINSGFDEWIVDLRRENQPSENVNE